MSGSIPELESARTLSTRQQYFVRYFTAILIDLTVLNLFDEYWSAVVIDSFTISLLAAVLLQVLMQTTLAVERRVAAFFAGKRGTAARVGRLAAAWAVLFISKFIILAALNVTFGDAVQFHGAYHGVIAFIVVITVMLAAEELIVRLHRRLR